jgi:hypothetical protein
MGKPAAARTLAIASAAATLTPTVFAQPPSMQPSGRPSDSSSEYGGDVGGTSQNMHVTDWGDYDADSCADSATNGLCRSYSITSDQVLASLSGFTTYNGGTLKATSINYYGDFWTSYGTSTAITDDYCTAPNAGANQTAVVYAYNGVDFATDAGAGTFALSSEGTPAANAEDYCANVGGSTPPLIGTNFGVANAVQTTFTLSPQTGSREVISNQVGVAVDGVLIFSPYTGAGSVAPYDESLDTCIGHPAEGEYHYHGFAPCIHGESGTTGLGGDASNLQHSPIYGWAYDGFPIYGPFGYDDANDSSTVVRLLGGYECTASGSACTTDEEKAVAANWAFNADGSGHMDECNGRFAKTPEFPDGMYVYVLNVQENGTPDFPGVPYCVHGAASGGSVSTPMPTAPTAPTPPTAMPTVMPTPVPTPMPTSMPTPMPAPSSTPTSMPTTVTDLEISGALRHGALPLVMAPLLVGGAVSLVGFF